MRKLLQLLIVMVTLVLGVGCGVSGVSGSGEGGGSADAGAVVSDEDGDSGGSSDTGISGKSESLDINGSYTTKEDVALYLYTYETLPGNFITKNEAKKLGWSGGSLEPYAPGKCIGGDRFGNYEELLPEASGRHYYECDIDTLYADSRGAKRIVYSDDGLIFYTADHYNSFEKLYGDE